MQNSTENESFGTENIMNKYICWINPKGEMKEYYGVTHLGDIFIFPEWFGETGENIKETFDKNNEFLSFRKEGKSSDEILFRIIKRGFVRIRECTNQNNYSYSIQIYNICSNRKDILFMWAKKRLKYLKERGINNEIPILIYENNKKNKGRLFKTTLDILASGVNIEDFCIFNIC